MFFKLSKKFFVASIIVVPSYIAFNKGNSQFSTSMSFSQFISTTQFYLYGRKHCTKTGWEAASSLYPKPDILDSKDIDLSEKAYLITGANAGVGREITTYLASKGASVYMVCRSPARAYKARDEIIAQTNNPKIEVLLCDCGLESDIRRITDEFINHRQNQLPPDTPVKLDGLVCNAGALLKDKTLSSEGVEVTFATHLLFGTYLLGQLLMPYLENAVDSRIVVVSSGGMYNTKFPDWDVATSTGLTKYDGNLAYAYAKRGQVILCEEWQTLHPKVKIVSSHPGWTATEAVDAAYGDDKKYLEPLRSPWQGAEGIIWLVVAPIQGIEGGGFYLDRAPRVKHMSGAFFTEGSFTKNTPQEVKEMMTNLHLWANNARPTPQQMAQRNALKLPLVPIDTPVDIPRFMGRWHVAWNIPTPFEVGAANCFESYRWDEQKGGLIRVFFDYVPKGSDKSSQNLMRARIVNAPTNSHWALNIKLGVYLPIDLTYLIVDLPSDYSYATISLPDRSYLWILLRERPSYHDELEGATSGGERAEGASCSLPNACVLAAAEISTEEVSGDDEDPLVRHRRQERVMQRAIKRAVELGFDPDKIVRVPWMRSLEYEPKV